jgi:hypothetical protein
MIDIPNPHIWMILLKCPTLSPKQLKYLLQMYSLNLNLQEVTVLNESTIFATSRVITEGLKRLKKFFLTQQKLISIVDYEVPSPIVKEKKRRKHWGYRNQNNFKTGKYSKKARRYVLKKDIINPLTIGVGILNKKL